MPMVLILFLKIGLNRTCTYFTIDIDTHFSVFSNIFSLFYTIHVYQPVTAFTFKQSYVFSINPFSLLTKINGNKYNIIYFRKITGEQLIYIWIWKFISIKYFWDCSYRYYISVHHFNNNRLYTLYLKLS